MEPNSRYVPSSCGSARVRMSASDEPGLRLRQRHRPGEPARQHRPQEGVDLLGGAELREQVGVGDGEHQVSGGADVGRREPGEAGLGDGHRQLRATELAVHRHADQVRLGERVQRLLDFTDDGDLLAVEARLLCVALLVVRREVPRGQLLAQIQHAVEGLARMLGEAVPLRQLIDLQPFVEQEVEISSRQQSGLHPDRGLLHVEAQRFGLAHRFVADQPAQQCGAELDGDLLRGAPTVRPQPAVGAQRHPDVAQGEHVRVAVVELPAGDAAVDDVAHVLVDLRLLLPDVGDLLLGEPLGDVRALLEVHRRPLDVAGDADQEPPGEVVDGLAGRRRRIVVQRVHREVGGTLIDVVEDQRLAGVVVVHRGLVQADGVGDVVHPGAVIAPAAKSLVATANNSSRRDIPLRRCGASPSWALGPLAREHRASGRAAWRLTICRPGARPGDQSTGWQFRSFGVLPLWRRVYTRARTSRDARGDDVDPNPDYDASDELEYGVNWWAWILRGVYPPPAYPPV